MLIIGTDDPAGLEKMADMAGEALGAEYPLVGVPMVLEDGKWLDWMPPPGQKLLLRFREMKLRWIDSDYAEQMKLLDATRGWRASSSGTPPGAAINSPTACVCGSRSRPMSRSTSTGLGLACSSTRRESSSASRLRARPA
jgi:hypothetical protein